MVKIEIKYASQQIQKAFRRLPSKEKIRLVEQFERETRKERWNSLVREVRSRFRKNPISQKEINRICEEVRKELYEKRNKGRH